MGALVVDLVGMHSDQGQVIVSLYNAADGFPLKMDKALRIARIPVAGGKVEATFSDLPAGTYAVAAIHDENQNGTLDLHWYGLPSEGVATSNGAHGSFGPPKFKDAAFAVGADGLVLPMHFVYL